MQITKQLFDLQDEKYGDFQCKLTPGVSRESIIGVRIPAARKLAKQYMKNALI